MSPETAGKILDMLAARFHTTVAALWLVLCREVIVEVWADVATLVVSAMCIYLIHRYTTKFFIRLWASPNVNSYSDDADVIRLIASIAVCILMAIWAISGLVVLYSDIRVLGNPEYAALERIASLFPK